MELIFNSTRQFEKDLERFPDNDRRRIIERINHHTDSITKGLARTGDIFRPVKIHIKGDKSSLFTMRVTRDIRVIFTFDEDPLFEQRIVTLLRVVRHDDLEKAFRGIAQSLYQNALVASEEDFT